MSKARQPTHRVVLVGRPGAGKGTQARAVSDKLGVPHISTDDLVRGNVARGTPLRNAAKSHLARGELVPDEVTAAVVRQRLVECGVASGGFLLEGYPRTASQGRVLAEVLDDVGTQLDLVLEMSVGRDEAALRLAGRRGCSSCGRMWHVRFNPPAVYGICDDCAGSLEQRGDDAGPVIDRRLDLYDRDTAPLLDFYGRQGVLATVDASGPVEDVTERMLSALGV
ncbi:adenylate kinase family protein [Saccharopolyspora endophytica]|uniref:adenylate kinase family protein n=1 Tax=Saccharopolyspora endophytica TaxID=543886 RepID=UPI0027DE780C|nr:nucleoside monophosphate kinase [Saccharopolyspora endophytica]